MSGDISRLKTSWTKYDIVQTIDIVANNEIDLYVRKEKGIDEPILRSFLGINSLTDSLSDSWTKIKDQPIEIRKLFALFSAIFTHYEVIELFAYQYSLGDMQGLMTMQEGKMFTNLRGALVESGAAEKIYRRKTEIPYDFARIYELGEVGVLFKAVLEERLSRVGYTADEIKNNFFEICDNNKFYKALSLTDVQFKDWINGKGISFSLKELELNGITYEKYKEVNAIVVKQWLTEWDQIPKLNSLNRAKPEPHFYIFTMPALLIKRLYGVNKRQATVDRTQELYSQRKHSESRSKEIQEFIQGGFPWSTISDNQRQSTTYKDLRMPGWLPTSIIANILSKGSVRREKKLDDEYAIKIEMNGNSAKIILPKKVWTEDWLPEVPPLEIIDGQHRIKAFDALKKLDGNFELPIVAFNNLDFTWQAYLFYTINIKPKRINTSLAYDLIPLLRIQEWLEQDLDGPDIYRKVRAQEITEILWKYHESPWHDRINMLGETGESKSGPVSQNSFINSLITTFVKKWEGKIGGLFGGELTEGRQDVIQWDKETQSAFIILIWQCIVNSIKLSQADWVKDIRQKSGAQGLSSDSKLDVAFTHNFSFFTTDQGIRPVLFVFNDMCFEANTMLKLSQINFSVDYEKYSFDDSIESLIEKFKEHKVLYKFLTVISKEICDNFDWRTPSAFDPSIESEDKIRQNQNQFRGSGGYKEMRRQLLKVLSSSDVIVENDSEPISIKDIANEVSKKLNF